MWFLGYDIFEPKLPLRKVHGCANKHYQVREAFKEKVRNFPNLDLKMVFEAFPKVILGKTLICAFEL